jgi:hypothetical protein
LAQGRGRLKARGGKKWKNESGEWRIKVNSPFSIFNSQFSIYLFPLSFLLFLFGVSKRLAFGPFETHCVILAQSTRKGKKSDNCTRILPPILCPAGSILKVYPPFASKFTVMIKKRHKI